MSAAKAYNRKDIPLMTGPLPMTSTRPLNDAQRRALVGLLLGYLWRQGSLPSLKRRGLVSSRRSWANGHNGRVFWELTDAGRTEAERWRGRLADQTRKAAAS